jgi:hypothetical protein
VRKQRRASAPWSASERLQCFKSDDGTRFEIGSCGKLCSKDAIGAAAAAAATEADLGAFTDVSIEPASGAADDVWCSLHKVLIAAAFASAASAS